MYALTIHGRGGTDPIDDINDSEWDSLREIAAQFVVLGDQWSLKFVSRDEENPEIWGESGFADTMAEVFPSLMKLRNSFSMGATFRVRIALPAEHPSASLDSGFLSMCAALGADLSISRELDSDSDPPYSKKFGSKNPLDE